jgi:hypothetical protein
MKLAIRLASGRPHELNVLEFLPISISGTASIRIGIAKGAASADYKHNRHARANEEEAWTPIPRL